jgi:hypothetical protein
VVATRRMIMQKRRRNFIIFLVVLFLLLAGGLFFFYKKSNQYKEELAKYTALSTTQPSLAIPEQNDLFGVSVWASIAAKRALTYNGRTFQADLNAAQLYFIPAAFTTWKQSLSSSSRLMRTNDQQQVAYVTGPVVVTQHGLKKNQYTWSVAVPLRIRVYNSNQKVNIKKSKDIVVNLDIVTAKAPVGLKGLAIKTITQQDNSGAGIADAAIGKHLPMAYYMSH